MKKTILSIALVLATGLLFAQKKTTTAAVIKFDATTSLDKLPKADNLTAIASLDTKTGKIAFEANIKNFSFSNPRIQEHFNSAGWMDSEQFPTAVFKGEITDISKVNFTKDGTYPVKVKGELTMHGVTKPLETTASIVISKNTINATADFTVKLEDYGITGASIAQGKVAKEPKISVAAEF